jgi:hypothetical protein
VLTKLVNDICNYLQYNHLMKVKNALCMCIFSSHRRIFFVLTFTFTFGSPFIASKIVLEILSFEESSFTSVGNFFLTR